MKLAVFGILVVGIFTVDKMFISPSIEQLSHSWFAGDVIKEWLFTLSFTTLFPSALIILFAKVILKKT